MLSKKINYLKNYYKKNLLFIGLRGSRFFGTAKENSDFDLLVVVKNEISQLKKEKNFDIQIYNVNDFEKAFLKGRFEIFEGLYGELFSINNFGNNLRHYVDKNKKIFNDLLTYEIFNILKNQIKQFDKTQCDKFLIHTLLWSSLLESNVVDQFKDKNFNHIILKDIKNYQNGDTLDALKRYEKIKQDRLFTDKKEKLFLKIKKYYERVHQESLYFLDDFREDFKN